jgi:hypothetical protein
MSRKFNQIGFSVPFFALQASQGKQGSKVEVAYLEDILS